MDRELGMSTLAQSFEHFSQGYDGDDAEDEDGSMDDEANGDEESHEIDGSDDDDDESGDESGLGMRDVDVDMNLIKYFLESHASQLGGPGPASMLLSQLGIQLPDAPSPLARSRGAFNGVTGSASNKK